GAPYQLALMRRVAQTFRDQGNFPEAIQAYQMVLTQAPTDSSVLTAAREIADIYQNRLLERDSAQTARLRLADLLGPGSACARAGSEFAKAAFTYGNGNQELAQEAGRNAIIAFDSALVRNKGDRGAQDSLFAVVDRFVAAFPQTDVAKKALIEKGRRASETKRWDAMEQAFRAYATTYPN